MSARGTIGTCVPIMNLHHHPSGFRRIRSLRVASSPGDGIAGGVEDRRGARRFIVIVSRLELRFAVCKDWEDAQVPDFHERLRSIYGDKMLRVSGAELIAQDRNRF